MTMRDLLIVGGAAGLVAGLVVLGGVGYADFLHQHRIEQCRTARDALAAMGRFNLSQDMQTYIRRDAAEQCRGL